MAQKRLHNGIVKLHDTVNLADDWHKYRNQIEDRSGMFKLLTDEYKIHQALYVGSYLDLSPSIAIQQVTYIDSDRCTIWFFMSRSALKTVVQICSYLYMQALFASLVNDILHQATTPLLTIAMATWASHYSTLDWNSSQSFIKETVSINWSKRILTTTSLLKMGTRRHLMSYIN